MVCATLTGVPSNFHSVLAIRKNSPVTSTVVQGCVHRGPAQIIAGQINEFDGWVAKRAHIHVKHIRMLFAPFLLHLRCRVLSSLGLSLFAANFDGGIAGALSGFLTRESLFSQSGRCRTVMLLFAAWRPATLTFSSRTNSATCLWKSFSRSSIRHKFSESVASCPTTFAASYMTA